MDQAESPACNLWIPSHFIEVQFTLSSILNCVENIDAFVSMPKIYSKVATVDQLIISEILVTQELNLLVRLVDFVQVQGFKSVLLIFHI